jgi:formamidase
MNIQWRHFAWLAGGALALSSGALANDAISVGGQGANCLEDWQCINRLHPDIPMTVRADPGRAIAFHTRNASDFDIDPSNKTPDPRRAGPRGATVHPLTGPVRINGAKRGDVLAVTIEAIDPGAFGYSQIGAIGFVSDQIKGSLRVIWRLSDGYAESDAIPGVRIPNASFPGVITVLPGVVEHQAALSREAALAEAGGAVFLPESIYASPTELCGPDGSQSDACLRTIPPREHGGNLDIRYLGVGATLYLPCQIDGCGLAIGDVHFAQGDGEVAGTAIEMDAVVTVSTRVLKGAGANMKTPQYEGPARLLNIPSRRFYATTGFPLKAEGAAPPDMAYLASPQAAALENLSKDITLAARNALLAMIDYMTEAHGLTREEAYIVASVAVDLRIGQLVDAPNVGVSAILPLDIFVESKP